MKTFHDLMEELKTTTDPESVRAEIAELAMTDPESVRAEIVELAIDLTNKERIISPQSNKLYEIRNLNDIPQYLLRDKN